MESHLLVPEVRPQNGLWVLEWDQARLILKTPGGRPVFEAELAAVHRSVGLYYLYAERKIVLETSRGTLTFRKQPAALAGLRRVVELGLALDAEARSKMGRESLRALAYGSAMFVGCGGLFGLYCWYASWVPDPPPGHWIRWFGPLIQSLLLVLLGFGLAGPGVFLFGIRQWFCLRRIERQAFETQWHT